MGQNLLFLVLLGTVTTTVNGVTSQKRTELLHTHQSYQPLMQGYQLYGTPVICGGLFCGSAVEMNCCYFDPTKCCNANTTYCNTQACGFTASGWYCGSCNLFANSTCCNDQLTVCNGTVCGKKEDYRCCGAQQQCCVIIPEVIPTPIYAQWWFWMGLIFCFLCLFFIGFVLYSDRRFIKYKIDKARGLNPVPPPGMPFHRRASTRVRASFRASRQAVQRASVRMSQRRRRPRQPPTSQTATDEVEVTHISGPPPYVRGPKSLQTPQPKSHGEPPPPYTAEPREDELSALPAMHGNPPPTASRQMDNFHHKSGQTNNANDPKDNSSVPTVAHNRHKDHSKAEMPQGYGPSTSGSQTPSPHRPQYPKVTPSKDLTPRSVVRINKTQDSPHTETKDNDSLRDPQPHNPAYNPTYQMYQPATFHQPNTSPMSSRHREPQDQSSTYDGNHYSYNPNPIHGGHSNASQGAPYSKAPPNGPYTRPPYSGRPPQNAAYSGPPSKAVQGVPYSYRGGPPPSAAYPRSPPPESGAGYSGSPPPLRFVAQRGPPSAAQRGLPPTVQRGPPPSAAQRGPPPAVQRGPPPSAAQRGPPPSAFPHHTATSARHAYPRGPQSDSVPPMRLDGPHRGPHPHRYRAPVPPRYRWTFSNGGEEKTNVTETII